MEDEESQTNDEDRGQQFEGFDSRNSLDHLMHGIGSQQYVSYLIWTRSRRILPLDWKHYYADRVDSQCCIRRLGLDDCILGSLQVSWLRCNSVFKCQRRSTILKEPTSGAAEQRGKRG